MLANYPQYEYFLALTQLMLFMLAMGATLDVGDFAAVFRQPRDLLYGLALQLVLLPFLAVACNQLFQLPPGIAFGLVLVGALPGGTLKNVFTYLSRGNVALSIALSGVGALAAIVTIPLMLSLLAYEYVPPDFQMPVLEIIGRLVLPVVVPLVAGMLAARLLPRHHKVFTRGCLYLGLGIAGLMVLGSVLGGRIDPGEYGLRVPLAIILFCVAGQQLTMLPYRLLRWPATSCVALGIEVTFRNINLGLLLKALLFPAEKGADAVGDGVLFVVLYFGGVAFFAGLPLTLRMRRVLRRRQLQAEARS